MDDEIKGEGNSVNYKYRMHDPRVGRFFARDPLAATYPHNSPYAFSENNVIHAVELEGLEKKVITNYYKTQLDGTAIVTKTNVTIEKDYSFVKDNTMYASTFEHIYLDGKYQSTVTFNEPIVPGRLAPSAKYDYSGGTIEGKATEDWAYIQKGFEVSIAGGLGRIAEVLDRDSKAPDNSITTQDLEVLSATGIPIIGTGGLKTHSTTLWKNKGSKARIDVENPAPGERAGNLHYQDANNKKYMYNFDKSNFYSKNGKTNKYDVLAPKSVQKLLTDPKIKTAITKGKKYLNVD